MPSLEEIRTLTIRAVSKGVTEATADLNKLAQAQDGVAVVSDKTSRATQSVQNALERTRQSLDLGYKSQVEFNKAQLALTMGLNTGRLSLAEYNNLSDLNTQRMERAREAASLLTRDTGKLSEVAGVVESRMIGMSASLGLVGEVLSIIGPFGLAAAAGVGAVAVASFKLTESANRLGEWSRQLRDTGETIGLSTTQLQAFNVLAAGVGVNVESNTMAFEKFTVGLGQLKAGTGSLYTELSKVSPVLVSQLSVTKDNVTAWNLLAQAYARADAQQQVLIAHAVFGRGGASEGRVLLASNQAGGIGGAVADMNQLDVITQEQIKHWAELGKRIEDATNTASRNMASVFTGPVLEAEAKFADKYLEFSREVKSFALTADWHTFVSGTAKVLEFLAHPVASIGQAIGTAAYNRLVPSFDQRAGGMFPAEGGLDESARGGRFPALGAPAPTGESLGVRLARETARNAVLGQSASIMDIVRQKQDELNQKVADGVPITQAEIANQVQLTRNRALGVTAIQQQIDTSKIELATIGMTTAAATAYRLEQTRVAQARRDGQTLTMGDVAALHQEALAAGEAAAALENTRQATELAGTFASGFFTDISHGVTAVDALHNAVTRLADSLIDMATRQLVTAAFGGLLKSFLPGGDVLSGGLSLGQGGIGHAHSGGILGADALPSKYVHPAYFDNAPRFHSGGIAGDEVPIIARKGEGIFTPAQMAAMGGATIKQDIVFRIEGAVTEDAITNMINRGMAKATQQAVSIANANAPARMDRASRLGQ